jgi:hypothetical protein
VRFNSDVLSQLTQLTRPAPKIERALKPTHTLKDVLDDDGIQRVGLIYVQILRDDDVEYDENDVLTVRCMEETAECKAWVHPEDVPEGVSLENATLCLKNVAVMRVTDELNKRAVFLVVTRDNIESLEAKESCTTKATITLTQYRNEMNIHDTQDEEESPSASQLSAFELEERSKLLERLEKEVPPEDE